MTRHALSRRRDEHFPTLSGRSRLAAQPPAFLLADQPGAGSVALASLLAGAAGAGEGRPRMMRGGARRRSTRRIAGILAAHHPPKAKRVIYLFMSGGPSQLDLFDYKPLLNQMNGQDLPESVRMGQRLTGDVGEPGDVADGRLDLSVCHATASRARGSAISCRTPHAWPTSSASSTRSTPRRSTTTRRSPSSRPARRSPAGRRWGPG